MTLEGTVMNGVVVLDDDARLPEGARVHVEVRERLEYPHPMAPYDREKELALLKSRHEESVGGGKSFTLEEVQAEFAREFNLPK